jgi:DNA-binding beta-propeller fold protein YncE
VICVIQLRVVNCVTKSSSIPLDATPTGLAVDSSTHLVYVADHDGKAIQVIRPL